MSTMPAFTATSGPEGALEEALPNGVPDGLLGVGKRALDLLIAVPLTLFLLPVFVFIGIAIALENQGTIIFSHRRCGRHGKPFTLFKFRTMRADADEMLKTLLSSSANARKEWDEHRKLKKDPRVTPLGMFLRRSSLDELPQLINVIRGDMSLVGPRPVIGEELTRFGPLAPVYEAARPGITGLWQISGRNEASFDDRVQMDVQYVREWSFLKDVKILIKTGPAVLFARGAY